MAGKQDRAFLRLLPDLIGSWRHSLERSNESDLQLGAAGALLACAEIETLSAGTVPVDLIRSLIEKTRRAAHSELDLFTHKADVYLGLAHGLAGYLLALEAAQSVLGRGLKPSLRTELVDAIAQERFEGPGGSALWPVRSNSEGISIHGWCHGGPGIGLAFLAGFAMTRRKEYRQLAELALKGATRYSSGSRSFCCGSIGRAQILIEAFRVTGEEVWLKKAVSVAKERVPTPRPRRRGFHRGTLGAFYLERRLADPNLPLLGLGPLSVSA